MTSNEFFYRLDQTLFLDILFLVLFPYILFQALSYLKVFKSFGLIDMGILTCGFLVFQLVNCLVVHLGRPECSFSCFYVNDFTYACRAFIIVIALIYLIMFLSNFYSHYKKDFIPDFPYVEFLLLFIITIEGMQLLLQCDHYSEFI
jgi:hypothetical protein